MHYLTDEEDRKLDQEAFLKEKEIQENLMVPRGHVIVCKVILNEP